MTEEQAPFDQIVRDLRERAKELNCLYQIDEILRDTEKPFEKMLEEVIAVVPPGWQFPASCTARIILRDLDIHTPGFAETPWKLCAPIVVSGAALGEACVHYTEPMPDADEGPFLKEERQLLDTIADRIAQWVEHRELTRVFGQMDQSALAPPVTAQQEWRIIVDLLRRTDLDLYNKISRKMLNHLSWCGIEDVEQLLLSFSGRGAGNNAEMADENRPSRRSGSQDLDALARTTFEIAAKSLSGQELLSRIQIWIREDRVNFLLHALERYDTSLPEIANALERFRHTGVEAKGLSHAVQSGIKVSLIKRLLTDNLGYIDSCRQWAEIEDFIQLTSHTIVLENSHGKLGGKASGLFLAAQIVRRSEESRELGEIRVPKTWYLPSDGMIQFLAYNNLDDIYNWKYRDVDEIRREYPHLLQLIKISRFPPEIVQGLSSALDDFGDRPLIVRSSSLLEDRAGSAFSGKYRSLFLANQGDKADRLSALLDAVAEAYASVFGPDPIEYRAERGLLDHHEEMGIMIQEVVGFRAGRYFLPAYAGVAFSNNELRWSPRIKREDGLLRIVPGLGTRAVDRMADDYPILAAPGQPSLRVNVTPEEIYRYSPRMIDVINLEANSFETVDRHTFLREAGAQIPGINQLVSVFEKDIIRRPSGLQLGFDHDNVVFTFDGLLGNSEFVGQMSRLLKLLQDNIGSAVDIEFASDGEHFYLLQCRPQSSLMSAPPAPIPRDIPRDKLLFSANRFVSNAFVPDITHIVYVDPERYSQLGELADLRSVGRVVGTLNKRLPKRQFILMGPGRWGSRGDIKLGVSVTYADINNTAVLIEIARQKGSYVPDLSFGTHFFQDLVESGIPYLPLYPDDSGVVFNELFLKRAENVLPRLIPEFEKLSEVVHVIDVPEVTGGKILRLLLNADLDEAVAVVEEPSGDGGPPSPGATQLAPPRRPSDDHWRWRLSMAKKIASELNAKRFGVKALYVFGSTKNATARAGSDLDLIVHFMGTPEMREDLELWLEGWGLCLGEMNFLRTGYPTENLLDVHIVTDDDIAGQTSYAVKIGSITDPARPLPLGKAASSGE
jgi:predicted nucleotidyltransferase